MFNWFKKKKQIPSNVIPMPLPAYLDMTPLEWRNLLLKDPDEYCKRLQRYTYYKEHTS